MPVLNKMKKYKTNYIPIKPVMKDESTTSNNIQILEDIVGYQPMALDIIMVTCNSRPIPVCGTHPGLGGFQTLEVES